MNLRTFRRPGPPEDLERGEPLVHVEGKMRVLLTTEGTYPHYTGGVSTWCDLLVSQLDDVDFVVWSLMMNPFIKQQFTFPENVRQFVGVPLWGVEQPAEYTRELPAAEVFRASRRTHNRDVETHFLPLFTSFLESVSTALFDPLDFAELLVAMHDYFREWEYRSTWRSPIVWEAFCQFLLARPELATGPSIPDEESGLVPKWAQIRDHIQFLMKGDGNGDAGDGDGRAPAGGRDDDPRQREMADEDSPRIAEAIEGLRLLYRLLQTLNVEVPRADVTHSAAAAFCAIPCLLSSVERNTPFLLTEHGVYLREQYLAIDRALMPFHLKRFLIDLISAVAQTSYALADQVSPVCRFNTRWETVYGAPENRIKVIYNGVSERVFRPQPATIRVPTAVQLARIDPLKDQITMLRVADRVRREIPNVRFLHYGPVADDGYWDEVRALHTELRLQETVSFMGNTDDPSGALNQGHVAFLTSISEAFPYTVVEALMCGKQVVSTDVGGVREAIGTIGATAPPRDVEGLAAALLVILRQSDEDLERLGREARERAVEHFTLERFVDEYRSSYEELSTWRAEVIPLRGEPPAGEPPPGGPVVTTPAGVPGGTPSAAGPAPPESERDEVPVGAAALSGVQLEAGASSEAVAALFRALSDTVPRVRREAVRAFARLGGPLATKALAETAQRDPAAEVREAAVLALFLLLSPRRRGGPDDLL
jgi:polysaccharide biosynthesis protein PelF